MKIINQLTSALPALLPLLTSRKATFALLFLTLVSTCDRAHTHEGGDGHDHDAPTEKMSNDRHHDDDHDGHDEDEGIHLTIAQIQTMDIGFGDFTNLKINDYVSATGTLDLPPNGYADVSARATGFVRNSRNYVEGDHVKKGATLGYLENPDFIDHQQRYLELAGRTHLPARGP